MRHIAIKRLVSPGTADQPNWDVELCPFDFAPAADTTRAPDEGAEYLAYWQDPTKPRAKKGISCRGFSLKVEVGAA